MTEVNKQNEAVETGNALQPAVEAPVSVEQTADTAQTQIADSAWASAEDVNRLLSNLNIDNLFPTGNAPAEPVTPTPESPASMPIDSLEPTLAELEVPEATPFRLEGLQTLRNGLQVNYSTEQPANIQRLAQLRTAQVITARRALTRLNDQHMAVLDVTPEDSVESKILKVMDFQARNQLVEDGIAGVNTTAKLQEIYLATLDNQSGTPQST